MNSSPQKGGLDFEIQKTTQLFRQIYIHNSSGLNSGLAYFQWLLEIDQVI